MTCDVDLVRQILLNIEHRGAVCPLEALRADLRHESDERVRYHLQIVLDARWVAEVDRLVGCPPGVRLTHAGHEFVEVARDDARWRVAKAVVVEETGGQSLAMLRALLTKWAWRSVVRRERHQRPRRRYRRYVESAVPAWWDGADAPSPDSLDDDQVRLVRRRRHRGRIRPHAPWSDDLYEGLADELNDRERSATLPPHII
ncbi:MAG TPA: DUF2513 domain-containing protein [Lacipirellulaceae bacterium]|jgi:hypothetical protein